MFERLLARGASFVSQAAQSVSSLVVRRHADDFQLHWDEITNFYSHVNTGTSDTDPLNKSDLLETSGIRKNLEAMMELLRKEDDEGGYARDSTGPCMELLLDHKILDQLCALALVNRPPGMTSLVLRQLILLLRKIRQPMLPHMAVHVPITELVRKLVEQTKSKASPQMQSELVDLLCTLCGKVQHDPSLLGFFVSNSSGWEKRGEEPQYLLFSALLRFMKLGDSNGEKARTGLISLLHLDDLNLSRFISNDTAFATMLVEWVSEAYRNLPTSLDQPSNQSLIDTDAFQIFSDRLRYCNTVTKAASKLVGAKVTGTFRTDFLLAVLLPALLTPDVSAALMATEYLRYMIGILTAPPLVSVFCSFIVEGDSSADKQSQQASTESSTLLDTLLDRLKSADEKLSVPTLKLFDVLISLQHRVIIEGLVLRYLYPHASQLLANSPSPDHPAPTATAPGLDAHLAPLSLQPSRSRSTSPNPSFEEGDQSTESGMRRDSVPSEAGLEHAKKEIDEQSALVQKQVDSWLANFPQLSVSGQVAETYDAYLLDAQRSCALAVQAYAMWQQGGPQPFSAAKSSKAPSQESLQLSEGPFVQILFSRLDKLLDSSLEANLILTGILSKLAQCPHPLVHAYLLDTQLPFTPDSRCLSRIIQKLCQVVFDRKDNVPFCEDVFKAIRRRLKLDYGKEEQTAVDSKKSPQSQRAAQADASEELSSGIDVATKRFAEGVIVLEEFLKELAAVVYAQALLEILPNR